MEDKNREQNENMGGLAGLGAGIVAGAQIGTVFIPVPFLGTFVGALAGGVVGTAVGQRVGSAALSGLNAFIDGLAAPQQPAQTGPQPHLVDQQEQHSQRGEHENGSSPEMA